MNYRIGTIVSGFAILIVFLFNFFDLNKKDLYGIDKCRWASEMKNMEYSGVVVEKMIDSINHNKPILVLLKYGKLSKCKFTNELSGFYDFSQIGDSLSKEVGSLKMLVVRKSEIIEWALNYGCSQEENGPPIPKSR